MAKASQTESGVSGGGGSDQVQLRIIVNGQQVFVPVNLTAPLQTVIPEALKLSGNVGQPAENWELKDGSGVVLDSSRAVGSFNFPPTMALFLTLKAGAAG